MAIPRGYCYHGSAILLEMFAAELGARKVRLCHGVCRQTAPPYSWMGHAWIEISDSCGVKCVNYTHPNGWIWRDRFYEIGRVKRETVKRYSWAEFCAMKKANPGLPYGPWDATIAAAVHAK